jgi:PAS domain S-box-containing protein
MHKDKDIFHSLIQNSSDIITILSTDGTILYESPSIDRLLGYAPNELIGMNAFEMVHPDDIQRVMNAFTEIIQNRDLALSAEFRFRHKNGSWRVIDATGSNQLDNALIAGVVVNSRDVTERKKAEELLQEANKWAEEERAKSEAIIEALGDGISIIDETFKVLYQNEVHKNLVGGDKSGQYCYSAYALSDKVCEGCPVALSFEDGKIHTLEKRALRDKGLVHVEIKSSPLRNSTGEITACIEAVRDITQRRQIEEKLQESEERFRRIFEDGPLGIIISDPNYRVLKANKSFCEMLGYSEEELVGHSIEDFTHPQDRDKSATLAKQALKGEIPLFQLEKRYVKKNRESLWINLTATVIHDREGSVLYGIGMIDDITGRKAAEQEREQLISQLKEALANIKTLKGLIPICAWCKKIRDDRGYWKKVETYIQEHSEASFTAGICPTCLQKEDRLSYEQVFGGEKKQEGVKIKKRQCERIRLRKPFSCAFKVEIGESKKKILNAAIEDISEAGMCIKTDYPIEHDSLLVSGYGVEDKIGVVRWRKPVASKGSSYRVGISFMQS